MKKTIRLSESDLHRIIKESVKRTLNESSNPFKYKIYEIIKETFEKMGYMVDGNGTDVMDINDPNSEQYCSLNFF